MSSGPSEEQSIMLPNFKCIQDQGDKVKSSTLVFWARVNNVPDTIAFDFKNHSVLLAACGKYHEDNPTKAAYCRLTRESKERGKLREEAHEYQKAYRNMKKQDETHAMLLKKVQEIQSAELQGVDLRNPEAEKVWSQRNQELTSVIKLTKVMMAEEFNVATLAEELKKKHNERNQAIADELYDQALKEIAEENAKCAKKKKPTVVKNPLSSIVFIEILKDDLNHDKNEPKLYWPAIELDMNLVYDAISESESITVEECMTSKLDGGNKMDGSVVKWLRDLYNTNERLVKDTDYFGVETRYFSLITPHAFKFIVVGPHAQSCIKTSPVFGYDALNNPSSISEMVDILPLWARSSLGQIWLLRDESDTSLNKLVEERKFAYPFYAIPDEDRQNGNIAIDQSEVASQSTVSSNLTAASGIVNNPELVEETCDWKSVVDLERQDELIEAEMEIGSVSGDDSDEEEDSDSDSDSYQTIVHCRQPRKSGQSKRRRNDDDSDDDDDDSDYVERKRPRISKKEKNQQVDEVTHESLRDVLEEFQESSNEHVFDIIHKYFKVDLELKQKQDELNVASEATKETMEEEEDDANEEEDEDHNVVVRRLLPPRQAALTSEIARTLGDKFPMFTHLNTFNHEGEFAVYIHTLHQDRDKETKMNEKSKTKKTEVNDLLELALELNDELNKVALMKAYRFVLEYALSLNETRPVKPALVTSTTDPLNDLIESYGPLFQLDCIIEEDVEVIGSQSLEGDVDLNDPILGEILADLSEE